MSERRSHCRRSCRFLFLLQICGRSCTPAPHRWPGHKGPDYIPAGSDRSEPGTCSAARDADVIKNVIAIEGRHRSRSRNGGRRDSRSGGRRVLLGHGPAAAVELLLKLLLLVRSVSGGGDGGRRARIAAGLVVVVDTVGVIEASAWEVEDDA